MLMPMGGIIKVIVVRTSQSPEQS